MSDKESDESSASLVGVKFEGDQIDISHLLDAFRSAQDLGSKNDEMPQLVSMSMPVVGGYSANQEYDLANLVAADLIADVSIEDRIDISVLFSQFEDPSFSRVALSGPVGEHITHRYNLLWNDEGSDLFPPADTI